MAGHYMGERGDPSFIKHAACRGQGPDEFFSGESGIPATGREICDRCPVRTECLEYALANREQAGVWGGLSVKRRAAIARERNAVARFGQIGAAMTPAQRRAMGATA